MLQLPNISDSPLFPILENSSDGIGFAVPQPWRIVYANPTLVKWLGGPLNEFGGQTIEKVFPGANADELRTQLDGILCCSDGRESVAHELALAAGPQKSVKIRLQRIVFEGTALIGIVIPGSSVAQRLEPTSHVAGCDPLTGLADRSVLMARMASLLRGDRAADLQFAVLFIDLDNFKLVNDEHGHLIGDRVLEEVARRLAGCVRMRDLIVRYGGDEFVALVENVYGMSEIQPVIDRIDAALAKPIALARGEVTLSVSVGVAEASPGHRTPEDLLQDADRAMYASKRLPR